MTWLARWLVRCVVLSLITVCMAWVTLVSPMVKLVQRIPWYRGTVVNPMPDVSHRTGMQDMHKGHHPWLLVWILHCNKFSSSWDRKRIVRPTFLFILPKSSGCASRLYLLLPFQWCWASLELTHTPQVSRIMNSFPPSKSDDDAVVVRGVDDPAALPLAGVARNVEASGLPGWR